jgi:hypothetical protein
MTTDLKITVEPGFLRVVSTQSVSSSSLQEFLEQLRDAARDIGVCNILVDARGASGFLSTMTRFDYASHLAKELREFRIAFVLPEALRDPDVFGETVAVNRGGRFRLFSTLEEAYQWLEVKPANKTSGGDSQWAAPHSQRLGGGPAWKGS